MQEKTTRTIYNVWAYVYDACFWPGIVRRRASRAIAQMHIAPGERILDIGVGTGLALPAYPEHAQVVGIDLSEGMLKRAKERLVQDNLNHIRLTLGNALQLPFSSETFDYVLLSHVITVVSDPVKVIDEIRRVAKPGARVVLINHFQSTNRVVALFERWVNPICQWLGWKSDLSLEDLIRKTDLQIDYRYKLDMVDLFQTVFATIKPSAVSPRMATA